ncbi:MAG: ATP synthase F1 subunit gamma [Treponema sp.]|nr:ATP synthase F1 subunit gamma [Treponema sp.]
MSSKGNLRDHMKSVKQTVKISNAQKLIAGAHIVKARKMLERSQPYHDRIRLAIASVLENCESKSKYLDTGKEVKNLGLLVISADRGLAGGYNQNVIKMALQAIENKKVVKVLTVGHIGYSKFSHINIISDPPPVPLDESFICAAENPTLFSSREIAERLVDLFENGEVDCFDIIYTKFQSAVRMVPSTERLFPLSPEDTLVSLNATSKDAVSKELAVHYSEYEPSPDAVLNTLIPQYLRGYIFSCLIQAWMCELNSRVTAMDSAIKNGNDMLRKLALKYNRVRQGSITQELTEIVAGAASMG